MALNEKPFGRSRFATFARTKRGKWVLSIVAVLIVGMAVMLAIGIPAMRIAFASNTAFDSGTRELYLPPNTNQDGLVDSLLKGNIVRSTYLVRRYMSMRGSDAQTFSGHYSVKAGTTTRALVNMIVGHRQTPVRLVIPTVRTRGGMARELSKQLWLDSATIAAALVDSAMAQAYGETVETLPAMFLPNTYEVYWDLSLEGLFSRMQRERDAFWTEKRQRKADSIGLTRVQVVTLASIIQEEVMHREELPIIAGVYLNRLRAHVKLQACPTAKYAAGDMTLTRVYRGHLEIESPYNTYIHEGLPPGPIIFPSLASVEAVLRAAPHDYLFFCAREDFSGYHRFSASDVEHMANARKYQRALNRLEARRATQ